MIKIPGVPGKFVSDVHVYRADEEDLHEVGRDDRGNCPCRPRLDYRDKRTGKCVWVHRSKEEWS